jgi:hypothetical protein
MEFASHQNQDKTVHLKHLGAALRAMKKLTNEAEDQSRNTALTDH